MKSVFSTFLTLIDSSGREWPLAGPAALRERKGIHLLEGTDSLGDTNFDLITVANARQRGNTYIGRTRPSREITLPLFINGGRNGVKLSALRKTFLRDITKGHVTLVAWSPGKGTRWLKGTVTDIEDVDSRDPVAGSYSQMIDVTITCHDPMWQGFSQKQSNHHMIMAGEGPNWFLHFSRADAPSYPRVILDYDHDDSEVEIHFLERDKILKGTWQGRARIFTPTGNAGETILLDFDPTRRTAFSSTRGAIGWQEWARLNNPREFEMDDPSKEYGIALHIHALGVRADIQVPQYYEAGY